MVNLFLKETLALPSLPNGERPVSLLEASTARVRDSCFRSVDSDKVPQREESSQGSE